MLLSIQFITNHYVFDDILFNTYVNFYIKGVAIKGSKGDPGIKGVRGDLGMVGIQGPRGPKGETGTGKFFNIE